MTEGLTHAERVTLTKQYQRNIAYVVSLLNSPDVDDYGAETDGL